MKVLWTPEALQDRLDIWDHIAADSRRVATGIDSLFSNTAALPEVHPELGRTGLVSGTRELFASFHATGVEFLVVGGHAVACRGGPAPDH